MPCPPNTRIYPLALTAASCTLPPPLLQPILHSYYRSSCSWRVRFGEIGCIICCYKLSRIFYVLLQLLHWKVLSTSTNLFIWYKMADNRCLIKITQTIRRLCLLISRYRSVCRLLQSFEPSVCGTYPGDRRTSPHRICTLTAHLLLSHSSPHPSLAGHYRVPWWDKRSTVPRAPRRPCQESTGEVAIRCHRYCCPKLFNTHSQVRSISNNIATGIQPIQVWIVRTCSY